MNEELLKKYHNICEEHADWWGWEEGYTWEEGSDLRGFVYNFRWN